MKIKPVIIIGTIYATSVAGFASGNLLHKFFGKIENKAEEAFNSNVFNDASSSNSSSSINNSISNPINSSSLSNNNSFNFSEVVNSSNSPYEKTTTEFERIPDGKDDRGYNVIYYLLDVKIKKIQDFRTNLVTGSNGYPGYNIEDTVYNQIKYVEKNLNVTVEGAISGDSAYAFTERPGYVIRNSQVFRSNLRNGEDAQYEDLVLWRDGTMSTFMESEYTTEQLVEKKAWQTWMFGPTLIKDGKIVVKKGDEIVSGKASGGGNQRVALGYLGPYHYLFFVSQGRTVAGDKDGFSLLDMATILYEKGCKLAYNLDGGKSATFYCLDKNRAAKKYPTQTTPRKLGDMIYVVDA